MLSLSNLVNALFCHLTDQEESYFDLPGFELRVVLPPHHQFAAHPPARSAQLSAHRYFAQLAQLARVCSEAHLLAALVLLVDDLYLPPKSCDFAPPVRYAANWVPDAALP